MTRRLRVLYIGTLPPHPGGTAILAAHVLLGLARRGHTISAIAPTTAAAVTAGADGGHPLHGIDVQRFLVPNFELTPGLPCEADLRRDRQEIAALARRACAQAEPDVIVIGREAATWYLPVTPARLGTASAVIVHGGSTQDALLAQTDRRALELYDLIASANLIIAVADHVAEGLRRIGLRRIIVIPNPVDVQLFRPRPASETLRASLGLAADHVVVVHVSNLKSVKRPLDLVRLARAVSDPRLVYVIVGDGLLRAEMEQECRRLGVHKQFRFPGWVPHDQVADFLNLADIVVMPSESEGQSLVHLETLACGRLLISSDTLGAREVVEHGRTGLLYAKDRFDDLVSLTKRAFTDPELRAVIGRAAHVAVQTHGLAPTISKYEDALLAIAGASPVAPSS